MTSPEFHMENRRSNWVRLRTLIVLRWMAIAGQLAAIVVAQRVLDLNIDQGLCFMAVGVSVIANLIAIFVYPENKRLSEREVTSMLLFDVTQLTALLFLTGGLHNPFALLILAPVTISATALRTRSAILVGVTAIALISLVAVFYVPLTTNTGTELRAPRVLVLGFWLSIVTGVIFLGIYARRVTSEVNSMSEALLAVQTSLLREQKITDIAGIIAATAHELGTPLATIKLTSGELSEDLSGSPEMQEDARLIYDQAVRCGEILHSMGRAGKDDLHLRQTPLMVLLHEAAEPHLDRGKIVTFENEESAQRSRQSPTVWRRPEVIHGLRNLIQNAVDFAETQIWITSDWTDSRITVRIIDDGRGFSQHVIGRIGDPFVRSGPPIHDTQKRPNYQGMGLGLFIAKTLLERSGAELTFANARDSYSLRPEPGEKCGAIIEVSWPRHLICPDFTDEKPGLGENQPLQS